MNPLIQHVMTSGTFSMGGESFPVDNNMWMIGDGSEVIVIDASHEADKISALIGDRRVLTIACTHAHSDHIDQAPLLSDTFSAPVLLNDAEMPLWEMTHPDRKPDGPIVEGDVLTVAGVDLRALLTPGHSPGGISFYAPALGAVFGGDTLFNGGPGNTKLPYADFPTIIESIRTKLLTLPPETVVYPGHGDTTTIGDEAPRLQEWIDRGW